MSIQRYANEQIAWEKYSLAFQHANEVFSKYVHKLMEEYPDLEGAPEEVALLIRAHVGLVEAQRASDESRRPSSDE